jgi:hypothetical protein
MTMNDVLASGRNTLVVTGCMVAVVVLAEGIHKNITNKLVEETHNTKWFSVTATGIALNILAYRVLSRLIASTPDIQKVVALATPFFLLTMSCNRERPPFFFSSIALLGSLSGLHRHLIFGLATAWSAYGTKYRSLDGL